MIDFCGVTHEARAILARLLRAQPRNPDVIALAEELGRGVVTRLVTKPELVTELVTPKRDRAKYMRDYRANKRSPQPHI